MLSFSKAPYSIAQATYFKAIDVMAENSPGRTEDRKPCTSSVEDAVQCRDYGENLIPLSFIPYILYPLPINP